jgi:hypothetical protein
MSDSERVENEMVSTGLSSIEIQDVARRQLVASVAVAIVIILGLGLAAMMPAPHNYAALAPHKTALVQQPQFVTPSTGQVAAATRREVELP